MRASVVYLCLFLSVCGVISCGRSQVEVPIEHLVDAVDSAAVTIWHPEQTAGDTSHHSTFYDSVLSYVKRSVPIEAEKRRYAQAVIDLAPLIPMNLGDASRRRRSLDSLGHYPDHLARWSQSLDSLFAQYAVYVRRTLDTLYPKNFAAYSSDLPDLMRRDIFQPSWRGALDTAEMGLIARTMEIIRFVDSNAKAIHFDTMLVFETPELAQAFDSLTAQLHAASDREAEVYRRALGSGAATPQNGPTPTPSPAPPLPPPSALDSQLKSRPF